jgi:hypothetical protein
MMLSSVSRNLLGRAVSADLTRGDSLAPFNFTTTNLAGFRHLPSGLVGSTTANSPRIDHFPSRTNFIQNPTGSGTSQGSSTLPTNWGFVTPLPPEISVRVHSQGRFQGLDYTAFRIRGRVNNQELIYLSVNSGDLTSYVANSDETWCFSMYPSILPNSVGVSRISLYQDSLNSVPTFLESGSGPNLLSSIPQSGVQNSFRASVNFTPTLSNTRYIWASVWFTLEPLADPNQEIDFVFFFTGVQLEKASSPSSYTPTPHRVRGLLIGDHSDCRDFASRRDLSTAAGWTFSNITTSQSGTDITGASGTLTQTQWTLTSTTGNANYLVSATYGPPWTVALYVRVISGNASNLFNDFRLGPGSPNFASQLNAEASNAWTKIQYTNTSTTLNTGSSLTFSYDITTPGAVVQLDFVQLGLRRSHLTPRNNLNSRPEDLLSMTGSTYLNPGEGSIFVEYESSCSGLSAGTSPNGLFQVTESSGNSGVYFLNNIGSSDDQLRAFVSSTGTVTLGQISSSVGTINRAALAWSKDSFALSVNGGSLQSSVSGNLSPTSPPSLNRLILGNHQGANGVHPAAWIRKMYYVPQRMPNSWVTDVSANGIVF